MSGLSRFMIYVNTFKLFISYLLELRIFSPPYENPTIEIILKRFINFKYKNDRNGKFFDKYER